MIFINNNDIRQKAELLVSSDSSMLPHLTDENDIIAMLHELKVHQVELELQNDELRRVQGHLQTAQNKYFSLYNFAPIAYFTFDKEGLIIESNLVAAELLGQTRQRLFRKPFMVYLQGASQELFYRHRQLVLETAQPQVCELTLRHYPLATHGDNLIYIQMKSVAITEEGDNNSVIHSAVIDITESKNNQEKLRKYYDELEQTVAERTAALTQSNQRLQKEIQQRLTSEQALRQSKNLITAVYDTVHTGICLTDVEGRYVDVNRAYMQIYGYRYEELIGQLFTVVVLPEYQDNIMTLYNRFMAGEPEMPSEWQVIRKDGQVITIEVSASLLVFDEQQRFKVTSITDITARKKAEDKLKYQAYHDGLTGLPNRVAFTEQLDKALQRAKAEPNFMFAVLFLDLNGFKLINDSLGHLAGDEMLITVAQRLQNSVYPQDIVARLGGDEFTVLVNEIEAISQAEKVADRINTQLAQPIYLNGQPIFASASIGIASSLTAYHSAADLLRDADTAMYQAKASGRGQHKHFELTQHLEVVARLQLESELWQALQQEEFILYFQPIVDMLTGEATVFEAICHWQHPQRGLLPPEYFLSSIEQMDAMLPFRQQVVRMATYQLQQWHQIGLAHLQISINLSASILQQGQFVEFMTDFLTQAQLSPTSICLEIPDNFALKQALARKETLQRLCDLGFQIILDDVCLGFSSLQMIRESLLRGLKIGPQFISRIGESVTDEAIVTTIINLAHQLNLTIIAEGVNTEAQLQFLKQHRCHQIQGNWLGERMSAQAVTTWLQNRSAYTAGK